VEEYEHGVGQSVPITQADSHQIIVDVMKRYGARCTAEQFQSAVNVTFHNFESQVYDALHQDMWDSLPRQFSLLVDDCMHRYRNAPAKMRVLDVGAGTGLATDCLLRTAFGPRIASVNLLDTSPSMLDRASARSAKWNVRVRTRNGLISDVPQGEEYDLIVTCSVLHHVPDLESFCKEVRRIQAPGGIFLHLQDPNPEFLEKKAPDTGNVQRKMLEQIARFTPKRVWGRIKRQLTGTQGDDYISRTNRALVETGIIRAPLTVEDLFAITDIHVHDERGISIGAMRGWLPEYEFLSQRSYAFFGTLASHLTGEQRIREEELSSKNDLTGAYVGAAWRLKTAS
jgi:2-polyprenyl-3-methyl-5-hydroxy-6-metoxy-1,4-benzoquinol methylase